MTLAVGIYQPRKRVEVDELRRVIRPYGVDLTFQIGGFAAEGISPVFPHRIFLTLEQALDELGPITPIELDTHAIPLGKFEHSEHEVLMIGPNTGTIPRAVLDKLGRAVYVETPNRAILQSYIAAVLVLHDRYVTVPQRSVA